MKTVRRLKVAETFEGKLVLAPALFATFPINNIWKI